MLAVEVPAIEVPAVILAAVGILADVLAVEVLADPLAFFYIMSDRNLSLNETYQVLDECYPHYHQGLLWWHCFYGDPVKGLLIAYASFPYLTTSDKCTQQAVLMPSACPTHS